MSLSSILSIARSALWAHQRAMAVTAQNVANAQTPGYTRERLTLMAVASSPYVANGIGLGVTDAGVERTRDTFYDATYRNESGLLGGSATMRDYLSQVESAVNEPSDTGISAALDGLFQSFGDLANDPSSGTNRDLVRTAASRLVRQLNTLDQQIQQTSQDAVAKLRQDVTDANAITSQIASLNANIRAAHAAHADSADLEDRRDLLTDQLSSLAGVRTLPQEDGSITVLAGDTTLVDGGTAHALSIVPAPGGGFGIGMDGSGTPIDLKAGSMKAITDLVSKVLPDLTSKLDTFTQSLVTEVNTIHRTGYTADGQTGTDFFDPAGTTARTIRLTDAVSASGDAIAAGGTNTAGDNSVALLLAGLANTGVASLGGRTMRDYYTGTAASVGTGVRDATTESEIHSTLVDHADTMRSSASGVSIDEEMVNLIGEQQAYSAAAHLVQVANDMMDTLMNMI